jgi:enoyl-CoA hydratase/carnithine racemase
MGGQDAGAISRELPGIEAVYDSLEACTKPVIAAVQGPAIGGGLLLALITDLCLAAEGASFGAPEVKIGIFPNLRLIPRLERMIGLRPAKRLVLTGDALDASEAQRLGLVDRVLPAEVLHAEAQVQAEQLAGLPAVAVRAAKATFARVADPDFTVWEREQFATCWARPERESAMRAFLAPR